MNDQSTYSGPTAAAKLVALIKAALNSKADKTNATKSVAGLMSAADKAKLDGIAEGATKITVDSELSSGSTNPVMNGTVTVALSGKAGQADLAKKLDKTGGTITGNLKVDGDFEPVNGLTTSGGVYAQTVSTPVLVLHDNGTAGANASINVSGAGAVEVTVPDGDKRAKARLKIGTPTEDDDATTKEYVDSKSMAGGGVIVDTDLSSTSTNPVQNKVVKSALDDKMDKSGGTFTGNVSGKYFTGTWLQTTEATDLGRVPGKIAVLDESGWVYYRTPAELLADIGAMSGGDYYTKTETDAAIAVRASLSHYGTTKLSTSIDSISKVLAATPYAVKTALDAAKAYADSVVTGADYVAEQGSNDFWTWRKWASGIAELWGIFGTNTLAVTNAWHGVYYGTWMGLDSNKAGRKYPFDFVAAPAVTATPYSTTSADFWLLTDNANNIGTALTHAPAYACVLPTSATITDPQIHYHVIGKYK